MASKAMKYPPVYDPVPLTFVQRIVKVFWGVFLVPYFFQKVWKRLLHLITGKSEIERLLETPATAALRALNLCTRPGDDLELSGLSESIF
jgi:hypothetical protein